MFSGVSGLRAHQTRMDVIGNNVANVNTVGFKSGRVTFQEVFSQTLSGAGAPDEALGRGGTNPMQVGLGVGVATIDTMMTRGSTQRTDNPTDLSIEGEGFFIVKGSKNDSYKFTRAGNFGVDKLGNLVTGSGMYVYGWMNYEKEADGTVNFLTEEEIQPINIFEGGTIPNKRVIPPQATTNAAFAGNLDLGATETISIPFTVYDSLGQAHNYAVKITKGTDTGEWNYDVVEKVVGPDGKLVELPDKLIEGGTMQFDTFGKLDSADPTIIEVDYDGAEKLVVNLDFSKITSYAGDTSAKATNVNGYTTGEIVTFNIGSDGRITGIYSNGQQMPLGLIAVANFANPAGLQKVGENLFMPTSNSGEFAKAVQPGAEGTGKLSPGTLEMSNVDLSREFTDMIVTQRGFQANSRIITTSDEMLQELVNLKR